MWEGERKDLKAHLQNECHYVWIPCDLGCELLVRKFELDAREDECEFRNVACPKCGDKMRAKEVSTHRATVCPKEDVNCTLCPAVTLREAVREHLDYDCPNVEVHCAHCDVGCAVSQRRSKIRDHEISCDYGALRAHIYSLLARLEAQKDELRSKRWGAPVPILSIPPPAKEESHKSARAVKSPRPAK